MFHYIAVMRTNSVIDIKNEQKANKNEILCLLKQHSVKRRGNTWKDNNY